MLRLFYFVGVPRVAIATGILLSIGSTSPTGTDNFLFKDHRHLVYFSRKLKW
jgi:hypothetical protein